MKVHIAVNDPIDTGEFLTMCGHWIVHTVHEENKLWSGQAPTCANCKRADQAAQRYFANLKEAVDER